MAEFKRKQEPMDKTKLISLLEGCRSKYPTVFDIETTNICNMQCANCPRTTRMTRPTGIMGIKQFERIVEQVKPWRKLDWLAWETFIEKYYGINKTDMSENHFFTNVIAKSLILHGYGEPLLDEYMPWRIAKCKEFNIPTYISVNPSNLDKLYPAEDLLDAGLNYLKFSTDSVDDFSVQQIRGKNADFTKAFEKINRLIDAVKSNGYNTKIIITMLDLNRPNQLEDFARLKQKFQDKDVYIYLKSKDQKWLNDTGSIQHSIHWTEFCQAPWAAMSIHWDGLCTPCHVDYNNELVMGDATKSSLVDIWNNSAYNRLRRAHVFSHNDIKCKKECDMKIVGDIT